MNYNPYAVKRCVRPVLNLGGIHVFTSKSFTQDTDENKYKTTVNLRTGRVYCNCPDFWNRKQKLHPVVNSPAGELCKHAQRAITQLKRKGLIA